MQLPGIPTYAALRGCSSAPIQCTATSDRPQWPTYHFFNKVSLSAGGPLMEPLNDANAIFQYRGNFHIMMQAGGGNWTHGVSGPGTLRWHALPDALRRAGARDIPWDSHQGPCDGTLSFPDLGRPPYDGRAPVILYGPDCNQPLGMNDAPRVEVALPTDVTGDALLADWTKSMPGPVRFDGVPCSFPGRVWRSSRGAYWNMVCAYDGNGPWARYVSASADLMSWRLANTTFTVDAETRAAQPTPARGNAQSGAYFHRLPGGGGGGGWPTHMINAGSAGPLLLGTYDERAEQMLVNNSLGPQDLDSGTAFRWAAVGDAADGRLLAVAWVEQDGQECDHGMRGGFGGCARSVASLVRELSFDRAAGRVCSAPAREYAALRNATFVAGLATALPPGGALRTLPVPPSAGGAVDVMASFDLAGLGGAAADGFGLAVRAPAGGLAGAVAVAFNVSAPDAAGTRLATAYAPAGARPVGQLMNDTDLPGGDAGVTHLPAGTDPRACQALCLAEASCRAWVYVIRGQPAGSGDCVFKTEQHGCPVPSPKSSKQGLCVSGRGHEAPGKCTGQGGPVLASRVPVLAGERLDVRVLVDRPIVEMFFQGGRASYTRAAADFSAARVQVHLFNLGAANVAASNVSAFGMGCGWTDTPPAPGDW
eukprot:g6943.t1